MTMIWDEEHELRAQRLIEEYSASAERAELVFGEFQQIADDKEREMYGARNRLRDFKDAVEKARSKGEWP